jgi:radical SAM protein with 4Fe4S-binding SPASM domain
MNEALYRKIVTDASELYLPLKLFIPSLTGEPLLDPDIVSRIRFARETLPYTQICLFTNGSFLNEEFIKEVKDIDDFVLVVSVQGIDTQTRKVSTGLDDYDHVAEYTDKAIAAGINTGVLWVDDSLPEEDKEAFSARWDKVSLRFIVSKLNFSGSVFESCAPMGCCIRAISYLTVLWDGRVNLCCMDVPERVCFGDLTKQTVSEVWFSPERQRYVETHLRAKGHELPICKECVHPREQ